MSGFSRRQSFSPLTRKRDARISGARERYQMGELTISADGVGWIILEDGARVGGTIAEPFTSREAAERWVQRSQADEVELVAMGDFETIARAKIIREADPAVWARLEAIEKVYADDEDERTAAHQDAGTWPLVMRLAIASLEAHGRIGRRGSRWFAAKTLN
jgi:hypothetical protein